jgi:hypothetical protein
MLASAACARLKLAGLLEGYVNGRGIRLKTVLFIVIRRI